MARKRIRELTNLASLGSGGYRIPVDPPSAGDARSILDTAARTFFTEIVSADLAAHIADPNAHGISTFVSSLFNAPDAPSFLAALGFEVTGDNTNGMFNMGGVFAITWRNFTATTGSNTVPLGMDHAYNSIAVAVMRGDDTTGDVSTSLLSESLNSATYYSHASGSVSCKLVSLGV